MRGRTLVVILLILAAFYFLNPDYSKHLKKLGITEQQAMVRNPSLNASDSNSIMGLRYEYNDFYVCSSLTDNLTTKTVSVGVLGFVFKP